MAGLRPDVIEWLIVYGPLSSLLYVPITSYIFLRGLLMVKRIENKTQIIMIYSVVTYALLFITIFVYSRLASLYI